MKQKKQRIIQVAAAQEAAAQRTAAPEDARRQDAMPQRTEEENNTPDAIKTIQPCRKAAKQKHKRHQPPRRQRRPKHTDPCRNNNNYKSHQERSRDADQTPKRRKTDNLNNLKQLIQTKSTVRGTASHHPTASPRTRHTRTEHIRHYETGPHATAGNW